MGRLASAARARRLALHVPSIYAAANEWHAPSGHSELEVSNHNRSSAIGARVEH